MLGSTDLIADAILGGAFWLVMLIVAFIFGKAFLKKIVDKIAVQTPGGGTVSNVDQAVFDRLFSLGQGNGTRQIGGLNEERATLGMRFGIPVAFALAGFVYVSSTGMGGRSLFMEAIIYVAFVAYMVFIWAFCVRYDRDKLYVRGWLLTFREYDLRTLESITERSNGTYRLWFDDGRKVEVLRHITNSAGFYRDMRAVIGRNIGAVDASARLRNRLI